jgi:hypothetical protein
MRKEYTINELASILGCSRTAIVKKIKPDEKKPDIRRYRGRYDVVTSNGQLAILLDDNDLEQEKSMSKGANNVINNSANTAENDNIIDIEPEKNINESETVISLTERYTNQLMTLQKEMYNELRNRDNQILLLTTSEKSKEQEYLMTQAENKKLKMRNRILTVITSVIATVVLIWITFFITYTTVHNTLTTPDTRIEQQNIEVTKNPAQLPEKNVKKK